MNERLLMRNKITEIVFILDKSGSMVGLEKDAVGGFNALLKNQKKEESSAYITTFLFDTTHTILHDRVQLQEVEQMTENDFVVGGSTALLDTVGFAITHIEKIHKYIRVEDLPQKTIFVIMTDGMENASRKFTQKQIKSLIESKQEKEKWEFVFLAANIDAFETANLYGIQKESVAEYNASENGLDIAFEAIDCYLGMSRSSTIKPKARKWAKKLDTKDDK